MKLNITEIYFITSCFVIAGVLSTCHVYKVYD